MSTNFSSSKALFSQKELHTETWLVVNFWIKKVRRKIYIKNMAKNAKFTDYHIGSIQGKVKILYTAFAT